MLIELVYNMIDHLIDHMIIGFLTKFGKLIKKLVKETPILPMGSYILIQIRQQIISSD